MGPFDALWHWVNFAWPAVGVGCLGAALAKAVWRQALRPVSWRRLAAWASASGLLALLASVALWGRDGTMAGYALLVIACATALWAVGLRGSPAGRAGRSGRAGRKGSGRT